MPQHTHPLKEGITVKPIKSHRMKEKKKSQEYKVIKEEQKNV